MPVWGNFNHCVLFIHILNNIYAIQKTAFFFKYLHFSPLISFSKQL